MLFLKKNQWWKTRANPTIVCELTAIPKLTEVLLLNFALNASQEGTHNSLTPLLHRQLMKFYMRIFHNIKWNTV